MIDVTNLLVTFFVGKMMFGMEKSCILSYRENKTL